LFVKFGYYQYKLRSEFKEVIKRKKGVLFDLDGVFIDSTEAWILAIREVLKEEGYSAPSASKLKRLIAKTTEEQIQEIISNDLSIKEIKRLAELVDDCFIKIIRTNVKLFDGSHLLLSLLKNNDLLIGVVTNNRREVTRKLLEAFNLLQYFNCIITLDDIITPKPDPTSVLRASQELGLKKEEVIFVGDSPSDLEASLAAGIPFILLKRKNAVFESLEITGDFFVVRDLFELKSILIDS